MSAHPTPPPPPFAPGALQLPGAASPTATLRPPSPAPGTSTSTYSPAPHAAPSPFAVALPGSGLASQPYPAASPTAVYPLGPPPLGLTGSSMRAAAAAAVPGSSAGTAAAAAAAARGAAYAPGRQTKSGSVDPGGQADDELLPPPTPSGAGELDGARVEEDEGEDAAEEDGDELQSMEARTRARQENMPFLIEAMTPEQSDRHDAFRRAAISRGSVKRLMNQVLAQSVPDNVALVAGGAAKIFIGEIVEKARIVQAKEAGVEVGASDLGPLRPAHIQEAHRLYTLERDVPGRFPPGGGVPGVGKRRRLF